ncbi:MAG: thermonuclease family protein [Paracoccaceae bacterium]
MPMVSFADVVGRINVIDADTFDVGITRVRVFGIDAPEADQFCVTEQGVKWLCGEWVTEEVRTRFQGRRAVCEQLDLDRYDRVVARCRVDGIDIGRELVASGLAFAYRKYAMDYDLDEKVAAVNDRGLHASQVQSPAQFRKSRGKGRIPPDPKCDIKGNISSKGVKIYHTPGQVDYERTGINLAKGERWFCSDSDAKQAGWRQAKR